LKTLSGFLYLGFAASLLATLYPSLVRQLRELFLTLLPLVPQFR